MEIRFNLDDEDKEQLVDPYGDVLITNGSATLIERGTFLYEWLAGLIAGLRDARSGKSATIFVGEPNLLKLVPEGVGVVIEYGNISIFVEKIDDFEHSLRSAAEEFLQKLYAIGEPGKNVFLDEIVAYVSAK